MQTQNVFTPLITIRYFFIVFISSFQLRCCHCFYFIRPENQAQKRKINHRGFFLLLLLLFPFIVYIWNTLQCQKFNSKICSQFLYCKRSPCIRTMNNTMYTASSKLSQSLNLFCENILCVFGVCELRRDRLAPGINVEKPDDQMV